MQAKMSEIGPLQTRLLSWSQMTGQQCVRTQSVVDALRVSSIRASELLDRMARDGLAVQLKRGLYLLPEKLPPGGRWQPPVELAVWHYLQAVQATWQETGAAAFNHYGLSEQIANVAIVYNNKVSGQRSFGKLDAVFIKVDSTRLGNIVETELAPNRPERRKIGTLARVVSDSIYDYSRFGTLPKAYRWIWERRNDSAFLRELVECVLRYGNVASRRRIGWLLEKGAVKSRIWAPLKKSLQSSTAFIPLDPTRPAKGRTNRIWGVVENLEPKVVNYAE